MARDLSHADMPPLVESGVTVSLEYISADEVAFLIEMVRY